MNYNIDDNSFSYEEDNDLDYLNDNENKNIKKTY